MSSSAIGGGKALDDDAQQRISQQTFSASIAPCLLHAFCSWLQNAMLSVVLLSLQSFANDWVDFAMQGSLLRLAWARL
jgi:hypothetical protein